MNKWISLILLFAVIAFLLAQANAALFRHGGLGVGASATNYLLTNDGDYLTDNAGNRLLAQ
jgi:hypothetical protein